MSWPTQPSVNLMPEAHERVRQVAQHLNDLIYEDELPTIGFIGETPLDEESADGLYLTPMQLAKHEDLQLLQLADVKLLPGLRLGAGDSTHEVNFGKAAVKIGGAIDLVDVAIKPFKQDLLKAVHEHNCLIRARQMGFDTFRPLAVIKEGDSGYLITQRRDEITSYDNEDWTISPADTEAYEATVIPNLRALACYLACMHVNGLFHLDPQPKNFDTTDTGTMLVTDLEEAVVANNARELVNMFNGGQDMHQSRAYKDVTQFWYALTHPVGTASSNIFLVGESSATCVDEFTHHFLEPYLNEVKSLLYGSILRHIKIDELAQAAVTQVAHTS